MMAESLDEGLARLLGAAVHSRTRVHTGYTHTQRWQVRLVDGSEAFVKVAVDDVSAGWLRREAQMYEWLSQSSYTARLEAWEDGDVPILALEDLTAAHWPPPWRQGDVEAVLRALAAVAATPAPPWLPRSAESTMVRGWEEVAADPQPLLGIGWFDAEWLEEALPVLLDAARSCVVDGSDLLHMDVRSDNICQTSDRGTVLVDWNLAVVGPARLDVAFWLPSLAMEGGPLPESVLPDAGLEAALVAGFFAARVGLPIISVAPMVRVVQLRQLQHALPWACRVLGLPQPPRLFG